jgi:hypothetical protein
VFVTEAVTCSLGNALGLYENLRTLPVALKEMELYDLTKQMGLLQIAEALAFCHRSARMVHGNVSPEEVLIDPKGDWKLGGFHHSLHTAYTTADNALAHFSVRAVPCRAVCVLLAGRGGRLMPCLCLHANAGV